MNLLNRFANRNKRFIHEWQWSDCSCSRVENSLIQMIRLERVLKMKLRIFLNQVLESRNHGSPSLDNLEIIVLVRSYSLRRKLTLTALLSRSTLLLIDTLLMTTFTSICKGFERQPHITLQPRLSKYLTEPTTI